MELKCGIVGLPNVGKSTLFNALTKSAVDTDNYPFCTIKSNHAVVSVPDTRLNQLAKIVNSERIVNAFVEFVDIAGLVEGAHKGEGLGNQFLSNIRATKAIMHVVRCFENENIIHISGNVDPIRDVNLIHSELIYSDLEICERTISNFNKFKKRFNFCIKSKLVVLEKCSFHLSNGIFLSSIEFTIQEKELINDIGFLTLKPSMYVANVDEDGFKNNPYLKQLENMANINGLIVMPVCAKLEEKVFDFKKEGGRDFFPSKILGRQTLDYIIHSGYSLLNLRTYFTVGCKEVRAWTISVGETAIEAAGKIHSDFKKGFIRAQVISFKDFVLFKGERGARKAGKIRLEGKNYIVQDGDIINFLFNV